MALAGGQVLTIFRCQFQILFAQQGSLAPGRNKIMYKTLAPNSIKEKMNE
jgi:hypothetical protein